MSDSRVIQFFRDNAVVLTKLGGLLLYFIVGISFYTHAEGWSIVTAFNFTIVTIATVGER